jgi:hypothetical protein
MCADLIYWTVWASICSFMPGLLYSVNPLLAYYVCENYRARVHQVWCSETFDATKAAAWTPASLVPRSSNPASIYREMARDVETEDHHSPRIKKHRDTWRALAVDWHAKGEITADGRDEILNLVDKQGFKVWTPLLYVIPLSQVAGRLRQVPPAARAGIGPEYRIDDLHGSEFDAIEF